MFIYRINASCFISLLSLVLYNSILSGTANLCLKCAVIRPLHNMHKLFINNKHFVFSYWYARDLLIYKNILKVL